MYLKYKQFVLGDQPETARNILTDKSVLHMFVQHLDKLLNSGKHMDEKLGKVSEPAVKLNEMLFS